MNEVEISGKNLYTLEAREARGGHRSIFMVVEVERKPERARRTATEDRIRVVAWDRVADELLEQGITAGDYVRVCGYLDKNSNYEMCVCAERASTIAKPTTYDPRAETVA